MDDEVVCERWCVTKKDGVCVCVTKLCVKVAFEREHVTKWRVKDGV